MKVKDIEVGKTYVVLLDAMTSGIPGGCEAKARVIRAGFHYDVPEYETLSGIVGSPRVQRSSHESTHPVGVEIEWERQPVKAKHRGWRTYKGALDLLPGQTVINARSVKRPVTNIEE